MNWINLATAVTPLVVSVIRGIQKSFESREAADPSKKFGPEKKQLAMEIIENVLIGTEGISGKDLVNDTNLMILVSAAIDALVAVEKAVAAGRALKPSDPLRPVS